MRTSISFFVAALLLTSAAAAEAGHHRYDGVHAISAEDGMCYIEPPHLHAYAPYKATVLFRKQDRQNHFVGDPAAFGFDGPQHAFHGHHPLELGFDAYCYIDGPHFHHYAPAATASFELKGDIHWYVGAHSPVYKKQLYKRKRINAIYGNIHYDRPLVRVDPPAAYAGVVIAGPGLDVHAEAHVPVVAAEVDLLLPVVSLEIGTHGHWDHGRRKHKKRRPHKYKKAKKHKKNHKKRHKKRRKASKRGRRWQF